jgi:hypothetical protein
MPTDLTIPRIQAINISADNVRQAAPKQSPEIAGENR